MDTDSPLSPYRFKYSISHTRPPSSKADQSPLTDCVQHPTETGRSATGRWSAVSRGCCCGDEVCETWTNDRGADCSHAACKIASGTHGTLRLARRMLCVGVEAPLKGCLAWDGSAPHAHALVAGTGLRVKAYPSYPWTCIHTQHAQISVYMYTHMFTTYKYAYMCVCVCIYIYTHTCIHVHLILPSFILTFFFPKFTEKVRYIVNN